MLREGVTLAQQEKKNIYTLVHKAILCSKEKYTKVSCMLKIWLQIFLRRCANSSNGYDYDVNVYDFLITIFLILCHICLFTNVFTHFTQVFVTLVTVQKLCDLTISSDTCVSKACKTI